MKHTHRIVLETPNGPRVKGRCDCGYEREYDAGENWERRKDKKKRVDFSMRPSRGFQFHGAEEKAE